MASRLKYIFSATKQQKYFILRFTTSTALMALKVTKSGFKMIAWKNAIKTYQVETCATVSIKGLALAKF